MTAAQLALGLSVITSAWFLLGYCWRASSLGKSVIKTLAVGALALSAVLVQAPILLIAALCLGALGDLFLSRDGDRAFLLGLVAFALSHLAYVALFLTLGASFNLSLPVIFIGGFAVLVEAILFHNAGVLRWPVVVYVGIIATMGILAVDLPAGFALGALAAILFIISDTVLGFDTFVLPADGLPTKVAPFAVWTFYWAAQLLFLVSFADPILA
ncbi:lysoplasmalogenase [Yoonia sp. GPGPB17]|uniref:lysoplasmalogenase n=1 Tax=Yoonia sp. GPGPB17 TaxID=3026147 RepID=UPI0030BCBFD2